MSYQDLIHDKSIIFVSAFVTQNASRAGKIGPAGLVLAGPFFYS